MIIVGLLGGEKLIVGYDLGNEYSQISVAVSGKGEVETLSQVAGAQSYNIPTVLCKRNGVSVEGFSFDRLPESYAMMDAKALRAEAGVMRDVAGTITADMNRLFQAQEKAQKNRDGGAR